GSHPRRGGRQARRRLKENAAQVTGGVVVSGAGRGCDESARDTNRQSPLGSSSLLRSTIVTSENPEAAPREAACTELRGRSQPEFRTMDTHKPGPSPLLEHFETSSKKVGRGMAQRSLDLIEAMYDAAEAAQPITGRGIGYKLFAAGLIPSMAKSEMQRVYRLLRVAREQGHNPC